MTVANRGRAAAAALTLAFALPAAAQPVAALALAGGDIQSLPNNHQVALGIAQSQVVVIGKVVAADSDYALARPAGGAAGQKVGWNTATVKIGEALVGAKGKTHVRVGWSPNGGTGLESTINLQPAFGGGFAPAGLAARDDVEIAVGIVAPLAEGQEVALLLNLHPEGDFYVQTPFVPPLVKGQGNYDADLKQIRKVLKVTSDPVAALKAKDPAERAFAATTFVHKYRTPPQPVDGRPIRLEPVPAEESKLILKALAEMDWNKLDETGNAPLQNAFWTLGLTDRDGWRQPTANPGNDANAITGEAAKKWLADHADTYKLQRYVAAPTAARTRR